MKSLSSFGKNAYHVLCATYVRCSSSFTLQESDEDNEGLKPIVELLSRDENKVSLIQEHRTENVSLYVLC